MRLQPVFLGLAATVLATASGCGGTGSSTGPRVSEPGDDIRVLVPATEGIADTIRVSFLDSFRPERGPVAGSEAERFLHRHLYETLIRVDGRGRTIPGLAESWTSRNDGTEWEFRIRPDARFSDGSPLEAEDVRAAWAEVLSRFPERRRYAPWVWVRPESVRTVGLDRIRIHLAGGGADPGLFAAGELAVTRSTGAKTIPLGTGPYRPLGSSGAGLVCLPNRFHPEPGRSPLRFTRRDVSDPRDLLGEDADVVVISRRENIEYARSLPGRRLVPLPWNRVYLLLVPRAECREDDSSLGGLQTLREELALRILGSEARPASGLSFDKEPPRCSDRSRPGSFRGPAVSPHRILTWDRDPEAGRIASRLVALDPRGAAAPEPPRPSMPCLTSELVAEAAPWTDWMPALIEGGDAGYVISLRIDFPDPCLELDTLPVLIPWLQGVTPGGTAPAGLPAIVPLVATRDHLVLRHGLAGIGVDWDGTPILSRAVWDREGMVP